MQEGRGHLGVMRDLIAATGPIDARATGVADEAVQLIAVISALEETSVAPAIKRAVDGLARGFVRPVADGRTADLAQRQTEVVGSVEQVIAETSVALTGAVDEILARPAADPVQFQPMSAAEAVLTYADDFVPRLGRRDRDRHGAGGAGADRHWWCTASPASTRATGRRRR